MKSPFSSKIAKLRQVSKWLSLIIFALTAVTVSLTFFPRQYYAIIPFPSVSLIITFVASLYISTKLSKLEMEEFKWVVRSGLAPNFWFTSEELKEEEQKNLDEEK